MPSTHPHRVSDPAALAEMDEVTAAAAYAAHLTATAVEHAAFDDACRRQAIIAAELVDDADDADAAQAVAAAKVAVGVTCATMQLHIDMGGDAMRTPHDAAVALRRAASILDDLWPDDLLDPEVGATIRDRNGNTVGSWTLAGLSADGVAAAIDRGPE